MTIVKLGIRGEGWGCRRGRSYSSRSAVKDHKSTLGMNVASKRRKEWRCVQLRWRGIFHPGLASSSNPSRLRSRYERWLHFQKALTEFTGYAGYDVMFLALKVHEGCCLFFHPREKHVCFRLRQLVAKLLLCASVLKRHCKMSPEN